jgi:gliding motility-associated-like protein
MGLGTMQTLPMVGVTRWNWGDFSSDPYALAAAIPSAPQIYGDSSVCDNNPAMYYQTWGDTTLTYVWNVIGGTIIGDTNKNEILVHWDSTGVGTITVQVISPFGNCISPASAFATVISQSPVANFSYLDSTDLFTFDLIAFTDLSTNAASWQWNFSDGLILAQQNPYHVFENTGTYPVSLIVTSANGCTDTIVKNVEIIKGAISPNVFTPNGDGFNDYFYVKASGVEVYNLKIFNRWGLLMFESNSPSARWDGKTQGGIDAPDGTYFYTLVAKSSDQDYSRNGTVTLLR